MKIEEVNYAHANYEADLINRLRGEVFHVTSKDAFDLINNDGYIYNNKFQQFNLNTSSYNSYGRNNGWVCFLDFRNITEGNIEWTMRKYCFIAPNWFDKSTQDFVIFNLAYLILDKSAYPEIILNKPERLKIRKSEYCQYIPESEVWYPGDVPLSVIKQVLLVNIDYRLSEENKFAHELLWAANNKKNHNLSNRQH